MLTLSSWDAIQSNAVAFSKKWRTAKSEEAEAQSFMADFLRVFGIVEPLDLGSFEHKLPLKNGSTGYIDFLWKGKLAIEMKSRGKDLNEAFLQLQNYMQSLPPEEVPDLWMVCDFETIILNRRTTNEVWTFKTKELRKHVRRFANIAGYQLAEDRGAQLEVNVKAAEKMGRLHDALKELGYKGRELQVYLVRILFCLFADDTGIFSPKDLFFNYINGSKTDGSDLSYRLSDLFEVLNMPSQVRVEKPMLKGELRKFRYVNGRLFKTVLPRADFNAKMRKTLLECCDFDWSGISPAIFGAMFQEVLDDGRRREMGAHYTSIENIKKLIKPLFLGALYEEFERAKTDLVSLERFHEKIASLKFFDPACGCGNFLIVAYAELRELERLILQMKFGSQAVVDIKPFLKVSLGQFYGIEIEEFAREIAGCGMWLTEHQMNQKLAEFGAHHVNMPLQKGATIVRGNALRMDWEEVVPKGELSYILGNPPFVGHQYRSSEQKLDMEIVYKDGKKFGKLDYVCSWYKKAADYMMGTNIRAAFVSTNSIVQGESVAVMWKPLFEQGVEITFAHRSFVWSNEAKGKAAVYCVIVGFEMPCKQMVSPVGRSTEASRRTAQPSPLCPGKKADERSALIQRKKTETHSLDTGCIEGCRRTAHPSPLTHSLDAGRGEQPSLESRSELFFETPRQVKSESVFQGEYINGDYIT